MVKLPSAEQPGPGSGQSAYASRGSLTVTTFTPMDLRRDTWDGTEPTTRLDWNEAASSECCNGFHMFQHSSLAWTDQCPEDEATEKPNHGLCALNFEQDTVKYCWFILSRCTTFCWPQCCPGPVENRHAKLELCWGQIYRSRGCPIGDSSDHVQFGLYEFVHDAAVGALRVPIIDGWGYQHPGLRLYLHSLTIKHFNHKVRHHYTSYFFVNQY